jgi:hypothetical protein
MIAVIISASLWVVDKWMMPTKRGIFGFISSLFDSYAHFAQTNSRKKIQELVADTEAIGKSMADFNRKHGDARKYIDAMRGLNHIETDQYCAELEKVALELFVASNNFVKSMDQVYVSFNKPSADGKVKSILHGLGEKYDSVIMPHYVPISQEEKNAKTVSPMSQAGNKTQSVESIKSIADFKDELYYKVCIAAASLNINETKVMSGHEIKLLASQILAKGVELKVGENLFVVKILA